MNGGQATDGKRKSEARPPVVIVEKPPAIRPIKLHTLSAVRDELGKVYREARCGRIPSYDATRFCFILGQVKDLLVIMDLEARLRALEERNGNKY